MEKVIGGQKRKVRGGVVVTRDDAVKVLLGLFGFFLGRVWLFEVISPMGTSFVAGLLSGGGFFFIAAFFVMVGAFTKVSGLFLLKQGVALGILAVAQLLAARRKIKLRIAAKCVCAGGAVLFSGLLFAALNDFSLYFLFAGVLEAFLAFFLTFVLHKGLSFVSAGKGGRVLPGEALLSLAILMGGVVAGSADIALSGVSLELFMVSFLLLVAALKGGSALSAMAGVLIGFMLYAMGFGSLAGALTYAMAGLCAGVARERGKVAVCAGFLVGGGIVQFYLSGSTDAVPTLVAAASACFAFVVTPQRFYFDFGRTGSAGADSSDAYLRQVQSAVSEKLNRFADSFFKLSKTLSGIESRKSGLSEAEVSKVIDDVSAKVCAGCPQKENCWENHFYDMYGAIFSMLGACDRTGDVAEADIPESFEKLCVQSNLFARTAARQYELAKQNAAWAGRLSESRELVSQQLLGVSELVADLSREINLEMAFDEALSLALADELELARGDVTVYRDKNNRLAATLRHPACFGKRECIQTIAPAVGSVCGRKMQPLQADCATLNGLCALRFVEERPFRLSVGVAKRQKSSSGQSGDSFSYLTLLPDTGLIALSDGMGSGANAKAESTAAIELLELFVQSGFEIDLAVKLINSALVLKNSEDCFATLDICAVDLFSGKGRFLKIGAAATFLVRGGTVSVIFSESLPIGILNGVEPEMFTKNLKDGDMIVMVTDGLLELDAARSEKGLWVIDELTGRKTNNPQELAEQLIALAEEKSGGYFNDDMTVLAARVIERKLK